MNVSVLQERFFTMLPLLFLTLDSWGAPNITFSCDEGQSFQMYKICHYWVSSKVVVYLGASTAAEADSKSWV